MQHVTRYGYLNNLFFVDPCRSGQTLNGLDDPTIMIPVPT